MHGSHHGYALVYELLSEESKLYHKPQVHDDSKQYGCFKTCDLLKKRVLLLKDLYAIIKSNILNKLLNLL